MMRRVRAGRSARGGHRMSTHGSATPPPDRSHRPDLETLMSAVRNARQGVRTLRSPPVDDRSLLAARAALLVAMEAYADELTARRLPIPRTLRDDLRLMRG